MGIYSSKQLDLSEIDIEHVCNVVPDIPNHRFQIWEPEQKYESEIPRAVDRRYDLDVAPSLAYINPKFNAAHMTACYIYNILKMEDHNYLMSVKTLSEESTRLFYMNREINEGFPYKINIFSTICAASQKNIPSEKDVPSLDGGEPSSALPEEEWPVDSKPFFQMENYYLAQDDATMRKALLEDHLILANLTIFDSFMKDMNGQINHPAPDSKCLGMITVLIVGYDQDTWIARFPFGYVWGYNVYGNISRDYWDRYNRDRWILTINKSERPYDARTSLGHVLKITEEKDQFTKSNQKKSKRSIKMQRRTFSSI
jgi:hypothetical protein